MKLAEEMHSVSRACKVMGASRDTFYGYRELANEGDVDALINKTKRVSNLKNRVDEATEHAVTEMAIEFLLTGNCGSAMSSESGEHLSPAAKCVRSG